MHERKIAQDLVRAAGVTAVGEGARRVTEMRVSLGAFSHLDPEALRGQVEWWSHGTIAEGAAVIVSRESSDDARRGRDVRLVSVDLES